MDALKWAIEKAIENRAWLFNGAGVSAIAGICALMLRNPSHVQRQSGGAGSQNIQAGRDVNITSGGLSDFLRRQNAAHEASTKFRSAFAETITQIADGSIDPHYLIMRQKVQHDTAIFEFRHFIDPDRLSDFDAAKQKYFDCRSALDPAILQYYRSEKTGQSIDQSARVNLIAAINGLLSFADNP
jgi:hypothetical protein